MKPGYKTTEFWLSLVAMLVGAILASGAVSNEVALQALGMAATVLGSLGYGVSRSMTKAGTAKADAAAAALLTTIPKEVLTPKDPTPPSQPG